MGDTPTSFGSLLAGATAATVVDSIIFPLDTIKTRTQATGGLAKNGGFKGLYRGIGSVAVCTIPSASIFFFSYEKFKSASLASGITGWKGHLLSSALAEALSCAVLTPAEIVKQRAQVSQSRNTMEILRNLLKGRDVKGLVSGYYGLLGRNVPVTAIQFVLYENFKDRLRLYQSGRTRLNEGVRERKLTAVESGLCAGASGSIAAGVTTPMDVLKTRVMLAQSSSSSSSADSGSDKVDQKATREAQLRKQQGMLATAKVIVREEGPKALFRGLGLRVVWTSLGLSLYLGSYEAMKNYIDG